MLKALKNQLLELANDSSDSFVMEIEKQIGTDKSPHFISELRDFILVIPEMIAQIRDWSDDPNMPSNLKHVHEYMLTYLYNPVDFLNYKTYGLMGYLDDAYLVGRVYEETMNETKYIAIHYLNNQKDLSKKLHSWLEKTREILPEETRKIDQMVHELLLGNLGAFHGIIE
jgi:uncharacterized membrane protein YkvA (DUF1232 family)